MASFKLVLGGDVDGDVDRIGAVVARLDDACGGDYDMVLDGAGRFSDGAAIGALLERLPARVLAKVEHIIQPLSNDQAFDSELPKLPKPVVLDHADTTLTAFPRALELGYGGVTVRMSKGVFRALLTRGLCLHQGAAFQTSADLASPPGLALQQNLALVGALGLPDHELTGHHHLGQHASLPAHETDSILASHGHLYGRRADALEPSIGNGVVGLGSMRCVGFGYAFPVAFEQRTLLADWTPIDPIGSSTPVRADSRAE